MSLYTVRACRRPLPRRVGTPILFFDLHGPNTPTRVFRGICEHRLTPAYGESYIGVYVLGVGLVPDRLAYLYTLLKIGV
jgi:hypothetical protein